jgi:dipeptidyl aminopeptidase/acylaminoacyl peptidase
MLKRLFLTFILIAATPAYSVESVLWIESRGTSIPITLTMPDQTGDEGVGLVVLAHGHGGSREENGGFTELASMLADSGIASVRMDFPGCGESTEAFTHNNITNMLQDIDASLEFAITQPGIDLGRLGILGYSMGGRLAMLATGDEPAYRAAVLWAPVAMDGAKPMLAFFGGKEQYEALRSQALRNDSVSFTTGWGQEQELGEEFFDDLERSEALSALARFKGHLLVLHGSADKVVDQDNGRLASQAALSTDTTELHIIYGAGHDLGFYAPDPETRALVLERTVAFFRDKLDAD